MQVVGMTYTISLHCMQGSATIDACHRKAQIYMHTNAGLLMWRALQLGQAFSFQQSPLFFALLFFTMLERLASFASDVAIERDWLTQLVGEP